VAINSSVPFGFRSFGHRDGSAPTAGMSRYWVSTADTFPHFSGDLVQMSSVTAGCISAWPGSTGTVPPVGVAVGYEYYSPTVGRVVWDKQIPAGAGSAAPVNSTIGGAIAYVIDDPEMQFLARVQSSAWNPQYIGWSITTSTQAGSLSSQGNTTTGISVQALNSSTLLAAGSSHPFVVVDTYNNYAPPGTDGTDNSSNYNIVVVAPNNWARRAGVTYVST